MKSLKKNLGTTSLSTTLKLRRTGKLRSTGKIILATLLLYVANSQAMITPKELEISTKTGETKALCSINAFPQAKVKITEIRSLLKRQEKNTKNILSLFFFTEITKQLQELENYMQAQSESNQNKINHAHTEKRKAALKEFSQSQEKLYNTYG